MEEVHRVGVAAVLAADAELAGRAGSARPSSTAIAHQPADAVAVEGLERRDAEDAQLEVAAEERALDVVAGEAPASSG